MAFCSCTLLLMAASATVLLLLLQEQVSGFIIDLRDNAGGIVAAGYGVAQLLMQDGDGFCIVKYGTGEEEVVQMQETTHMVTQPLVPHCPCLAVQLASTTKRWCLQHSQAWHQ